MLIWGICKLDDYNFDTSELGDIGTKAMIGIVVAAAAIMVIEFQIAWAMWLKGNKNQSKHHHH